MSNEPSFCGNCGTTMSGPFCGSCGAPAAHGVGSGAVQDAPTRMGAVADEGQTAHRPQPAERLPDAETGWYESADASSGSRAPYADAHDGAYAGRPVYGPSAGYTATTHSSTGHQAAPQSQASRPNNTPFIAAGLLSALVLACLGGYVFMRGGDDTKAAPAQTSVSAIPAPTSTPTPSVSSVSTSSTTAAPQPTATATATRTVYSTQQAPASTPPTPTSTTSSTTDAGGGVGGNGKVVTMGGTTYGMIKSGRSVSIEQVRGNDEFLTLATITLPFEPDYGDRPASLELLALKGCSKPVLTFNSERTGSAVFGWNGSEYKAYKSPGGKELEPTVDANRTTSLPTYGVYVIDGDVVYRDTKETPESQWKHFSSCSRQNPDYLKQD